MEYVVLGKACKVSKVGMGVLPIGHSQYDLNLDEGAGLLMYAWDRGINFFDTAEYYDTYSYIRKAFDLCEAMKKGAVISSKSLAVSYDEMYRAIESCLFELDLESIDIFLMHEVRAGELQRRSGAWDALKAARERGLVRSIGVSTHHIDTVLEVSENPDCDVVFALINHKSMGIRKAVRDEEGKIIGDTYGTKEEMYSAIEKCKSNGKGTYIMKVLGGGNLTVDYQRALDYAFSLKAVDSFMVGFGKQSDINDMISYIYGKLSDDYKPDVSEKRMMVNKEDCLGCGACIRACASGAIGFGKIDGLAEIDDKRCITCGYCAYACVSRAIIML